MKISVEKLNFIITLPIEPANVDRIVAKEADRVKQLRSEGTTTLLHDLPTVRVPWPFAIYIGWSVLWRILFRICLLFEHVVISTNPQSVSLIRSSVPWYWGVPACFAVTWLRASSCFRSHGYSEQNSPTEGMKLVREKGNRIRSHFGSRLYLSPGVLILLVFGNMSLF